MGVEKPDIEIGSLESPAPEAVCSNVKSCTFCLLAVVPLNTSSVMGWRSGSTQTSLHTSVRRVAVRLQISLCLMEEKPPLAQTEYVQLKKRLRNHILMAIYLVSSHISMPEHHGMLFCASRIRVP